MPVFAFRKQGFHPDLTLAQGFLVGLGLLISAHPFQTGFIDTVAEAASSCTGRTLGFERAMIAVLGIGAIAKLPLGRMGGEKVQLFARRTDVHITLGVIGERLDTKELGSVIH